MQRRVLHEAAAADLEAADLELRLDEHDRLRARGRAPSGAAGRILRTEMNDTSMTASAQGSGTSSGESDARVRAVADDHARVLAQPLVELAAAHVDRVDAARRRARAASR